jgi:prepilin-type N-terminal cleavage/methylation domain-containing protein
MKKFTLIEIIVVVAIIGILASLLLPALSASRERARMAVCKSQLKQIGSVSIIYTDDNDGYYPHNDSDVQWDDMLSDYGREYLGRG